MRDRYHKNLFTIGAIWNWLFAVCGIAILTLYKQHITLFTTEVPNNTIFPILFLAMVFAYGIGYYWAGQNTLENRGIIKMGVIGKLLVFVIVICGYYVGQVTLLTVLGGTGDFIFTLFFLEVLYKLPKDKPDFTTPI